MGITRFQPAVDDTDELNAWWGETFGALWLDPERNAWLYEKNPCIGKDGPGPWLCRRNGRIVGQQAELPFDLKVGSEVRRAVWAVELHVDEAWRVRGIGPALIATLVESNAIVCTLDISDDAKTLLRRGGFVEVGIACTYRRALNARRALRMAGVPRVARKLSPVIAPILGMADALASAAIRSSGAKLVPVERFDGRVDEVWAAASSDYPVLARRDLAAVAWRIDERPDSHRLRRYYLMRRGRTLGYVVLRPTTSSGEPSIVVVDYLAPARWVVPMLLAVARVARRNGAVALSVKTLNRRADRMLRRAGFVRRSLSHDYDRWMMVHCTAEPDVCRLLSDSDGWLITSTDSNLEQVGSEHGRSA
ncbi:MAG: GNAT family N-acetyltransferase [Acidimicrobiales bacterium]